MQEIRRACGQHAFGYTPMAEMDGLNADLRMDFGVLRLRKGERFEDGRPLEKAYLLVYGAARLSWDGQTADVERANCFDVPPIVLHAPQDVTISVETLSEDCELCVTRTDNPRNFAAKLYRPADTPDEYRGAGLMQETSTRIVRTVFDYSTAPEANLVLGEVIGFPGKWSSYPPHHHPQPEIYYYKTNPANGFGYAELGETVYKVRTNDAVFIREGQTHPHCTAPGYALWYLWAIRHLEGNPYITPTFLPEHLWVLEKDAAFWPNRED